MNHTDDLPHAQIANVKLYVYEGDLVYDENGNVTNKLREVLEYTRPVERVIIKQQE